MTQRILLAFLALFLAGALVESPQPVAAKKKIKPPPPPPPEPDCNMTYNGYTRRIEVSGHVWAVKDHGKRKVGPGPNLFSASTNNVWVDSGGHLHLRITKSGKRWYAAEVINICSFGFGTYRFYLDSEVANFDPNVVLGLFLWSDIPDFNNRELDIEMSRWANPNNDNAQFVVQPYNLFNHTFRFLWLPGFLQSTHSFLWTEGNALFESRTCHYAPTDPGPLIAGYTFTDGIPPPGDENPRINFWLFQGSAPTDGQEVEVIVNRFEFLLVP